MKFLHAVLAPIALSGAFLLATSVPVRAADEDCQKRTARIDHKLHEAIEHHGYQSPEAQRYRQELAETRSSCWEHGHRWWDEDAHQWRTDRNWDEHDHDERH